MLAAKRPSAVFLGDCDTFTVTLLFHRQTDRKSTHTSRPRPRDRCFFSGRRFVLRVPFVRVGAARLPGATLRVAPRAQSHRSKRQRSLHERPKDARHGARPPPVSLAPAVAAASRIRRDVIETSQSHKIPRPSRARPTAPPPPPRGRARLTPTLPSSLAGHAHGRQPHRRGRAFSRVRSPDRRARHAPRAAAGRPRDSGGDDALSVRKIGVFDPPVCAARAAAPPSGKTLTLTLPLPLPPLPAVPPSTARPCVRRLARRSPAAPLARLVSWFARVAIITRCSASPAPPTRRR